MQHANHDANHDKSCRLSKSPIKFSMFWGLQTLPKSPRSHPLGHPCLASPRALGCIPSGRVSRDDGVQSPWSPRSSNPAGSAQWKNGGWTSPWFLGNKKGKKHRNMGSTSRIIMDDIYIYIHIFIIYNYGLFMIIPFDLLSIFAGVAIFCLHRFLYA